MPSRGNKMGMSQTFISSEKLVWLQGVTGVDKGERGNTHGGTIIFLLIFKVYWNLELMYHSVK